MTMTYAERARYEADRAPVRTPSWMLTVLQGISTVGAAARVSAALEGRRQPAAADLAILGIDHPLPAPR